jgi:hypothetical protein
LLLSTGGKLKLALCLALLGCWNSAFGQSVVNVSSDQATINYGAARGVKAGMTAYIMGSEDVGGKTVEVRIAKIEVISVSESQSTARILQVSPGYRITAGQRLVFSERLIAPKAAEPPAKIPTIVKTNPAPQPKAATETLTSKGEVEEGKDVLFYMRRGTECLQGGDYGKAERYFKRVLKEIPDDLIAKKGMEKAEAELVPFKPTASGCATLTD